jgi:hypothetical protein
MNEIQIIQKQLATERAHFAEVVDACARARGGHGISATSDFVTACADYFAFAVTRFEPRSAQALAAQLTAGLGAEFLSAFTEVSRGHFATLDGMLSRNLPVTEWRTVSRIDADSIFAERARYGRVKAAIPA